MNRLLQNFLTTFIVRGDLTIRSASGAMFRCGDGRGPRVKVAFRDAAAEMRLLRDPTLAFGELYMDEGIAIEEGTLVEALELALANLDPAHASTWIRTLDRLRFALRRRRQRNDTRRSRENVAHHYDLGNSLYELFLDADMQYSCAYFEHPGQALDDAQIAKKRHIAAKLLVRPHHEVLDIGCGWGGMAIYLASICGAQATGVTLSTEQLERARARAAASATGGRAGFRLEDYRNTQGAFDRIVSVGMLEHVGAPNLDAYFAQVANLLKREGAALIHTIGRPEGPGVTNPWIAKYIFPGGYIPALSELAPAIERSGLLIADIEVLRLHYADTLKAWRERFLARRAEAAAMYDDRFCRMWEFYLAACEAGFRLGQQVVYQFLLVHQLDALPITRDYIALEEARLRGVEAEGWRPRGRLAGE
ncbi:MAG: class I SAM-dependent methyltransferase [Beijerinckiaceae bacterium]